MARTYTSALGLQELDGSTKFANEKGNFECVALVQQTAKAPHTSTWVQGKRVMDCAPGEIALGTVIATFDETGKYPLTQRHAAIYENHDATGINVVDQWNSQAMAKRRKIRLKNLPARDINDAKWYYIVQTEV
jgi:hypothetical protein